jgi:type I restriction enzyme M protein
MSINVLQYESKIWDTANLLLGAGIKQSDFPKFMMPFFALIMLESRLVRYAAQLEQELSKDDIEAFIEEFQDYNLGYNDFVIRVGITLKDICKNDKAFGTDFEQYLKAFDGQTRNLLGVDKGTEEEKFLDISGIAGQLKTKRILFDTVKKWSEIDLTPFDNSDITTLEEHIKRKWADISAETAGEQYTPDDIISLIAEIILSKLTDSEQYLTIYDPTCGGGNLLFGVEDRIMAKFSRPTKTYGEDLNDTLYALAKIESRFRTESDIRHGNTLTDVAFIHKEFDVVVANPPYGVDWKGYKHDIEHDSTGRFHALPAVSDGQLLFTQHIVSQLDAQGLGVVVHNGSTLFSGDAGSGESNVRKWLLEQDVVEAIIQLPTDEFFNTGIYTYIWVLNKNKPTDRADRLILINGSEFWKPLKKSKGSKRREMVPANRATIVQALTDFADTDYARVFDKWHFYYNRQALTLTNVDSEGRSFEAQLPIKVAANGTETRAKSQKLEPLAVEQYDAEAPIELRDFLITDFDPEIHQNLLAYYDDEVSPLVNRLDYKDPSLRVVTAKATYYYDADQDTLIEDTDAGPKALGCGKIVVKAAYKKPTAKQPAQIAITVELTPDYQKDYEVIPFHPDPAQNKRQIDDFLARYVTRPFVLLDNVVGAEMNFNKVFYTPEKLGIISTIREELVELELELQKLEKELF